MKRRKIIRNVFMHLLVIHTILNVVHFMGDNLNHPLYNILINRPPYIQVLVLGFFDILSYTIITFIYARFYDKQKELYFVIEWVVIIFALCLLTIYAVVYFISLTFYMRELMLIYTISNGWYGTFMYKLPNEQLYSLWWMLSAILPSIGIYIGVKLGLRKEVNL